MTIYSFDDTSVVAFSHSNGTDCHSSNFGFVENFQASLHYIWYRTTHLSDWELSYFYLQFANLLILLAFLCPHSEGGLFYQRLSLLAGCGFVAYWGYMVCSPDFLYWNVIFIIVNFTYLLTVIIRNDRLVRFPADIERVYNAVFRPLNVERRQFNYLLRSKRSIRTIKSNEFYAIENVSRVENISLVLSGRFLISQNEQPLHVVYPCEFLDSTEWFGAVTDNYFKVTITALEDSTILSWHRDLLKFSVMGNRFLQAVVDHILGRDVVKKLVQVKDVCLNSDEAEGFYEQDIGDRSTLVVHADEGVPFTSVSRLRQDNCNGFHLSKIDEVDVETPV